MAFANFSAGLAAQNLGDALELLNPEYVSTLMNTDVELRRFFERLIGAHNFVDGQTYLRTRVHEEADASINSELSVFYRYFISKCYFNLINRDARSDLLDNYASIFPFQVDSSVRIDTVPILDFFDDEFLNEIREFIDHHVSDSDFTDLENMLVKNIESFRRKNFSSLFPMNYERLRAIAEVGSHEFDESEESVGYVCDYLNHVYRLNEAGVDWYMNLQTACNEVNVMYNKDLIPTKRRAYFKYLPEVNCCELLLLLEHRFYLDENERYSNLFKKYLFFFGHAVELTKEVHPVFFIDDALFACLTSLSTYLFSRESVLELEYEFWMMALVHLRMYSSSKPTGPSERTVDKQNLWWVANYVAEMLSVDSCVFYETSLLYPIRHRNFYMREDTVYRLMYVDVQQLELRHFYELILKAALLESKVRRLVIYNAYTGEEMIILMPRVVEDIRNLIVALHMKIVQILRHGRHRLRLRSAVRVSKLFRFEKLDAEEIFIPETFLLQGKENCISRPSAVGEVEFEPFSFDSAAEHFFQEYSEDLRLTARQVRAAKHFSREYSEDLKLTASQVVCFNSKKQLLPLLPGMSLRSHGSRHTI